LLRAVAKESCWFAGKFQTEKLTDVAVLLLGVSKDSKLAILRELLTTHGIPKAQLLPGLSDYLEDWNSISIDHIICDFIASEV
jgi:hypothetical protein